MLVKKSILGFHSLARKQYAICHFRETKTEKNPKAEKY